MPAITSISPFAPAVLTALDWALIGVAAWLATMLVAVALLSSARRGDAHMELIVKAVRVETLLGALVARDELTGRHSGRVASLARSVGRHIGLDEGALAALEEAGALHDVGKLRVPEEILRKPGALTAAEWAVVRRHPEWGAQVLAHVAGLAHVAEVVRTHHERYDGDGYPAGLAGAAIPLGARIVAVCDAFDAMIHDRPHRAALPAAHALAELRANAGHQFDPEIVAAFERTVGAGASAIEGRAAG